MEKIEVWWLKMVEIFTRPVSECYNECIFLTLLFITANICSIFQMHTSIYFYNSIIKIIFD